MQLNLLTTLALLGVASQHVAAAPRPDPKPEPVPEPAPKYDASVRDSSYSHDSGIVTALFRDINDAESRAEFKIGKWAFAGCEYSLFFPYLRSLYQYVLSLLVFCFLSPRTERGKKHLR